VAKGDQEEEALEDNKLDESSANGRPSKYSTPCEDNITAGQDTSGPPTKRARLDEPVVTVPSIVTAKGHHQEKGVTVVRTRTRQGSKKTGSVQNEGDSPIVRRRRVEKS
jgi:hypothetical protein